MKNFISLFTELVSGFFNWLFKWRSILKILIVIVGLFALLSMLSSGDSVTPFYLVVINKTYLFSIFIFGFLIFLLVIYNSNKMKYGFNLLVFLSILFFYLSYSEYPPNKMENARDNYYQVILVDWGKCDGCKTTEEYKYYNYKKNKAKVQEDYLLGYWQSIKNGIAINDNKLNTNFNMFLSLGIFTVLFLLYTKLYWKDKAQ